MMVVPYGIAAAANTPRPLFSDGRTSDIEWIPANRLTAGRCLPGVPRQANALRATTPWYGRGFLSAGLFVTFPRLYTPLDIYKLSRFL